MQPPSLADDDSSSSSEDDAKKIKRAPHKPAHLPSKGFSGVCRFCKKEYKSRHYYNLHMKVRKRYPLCPIPPVCASCNQP